MHNLTYVQVVQLVAVSAMMTLGQILLKYGADSGPVGDSLFGVVRLMQQPSILIAIVLYGIAMVMWVVTLQNIPLSIAYLFLALSFVLTPLAGALIFEEALDLRYLIGLGMIVAGIYVATAPR